MLVVLNQHYEDSNKKFSADVKSRDRNFLYIIVLLGIMAFQYVSPQQSETAISQIIQGKLQINTNLSINLINTLIWVGLLAVSIRYFQIVINLEKQYSYVHSLEEELSSEYEGKAFTREGKSYLENYAVFSKWLHIVYRVVFPVLILIAISAKIYSEWKVPNHAVLPFALDLIIYSCLVIAMALYLYSINSKDAKKLYKRIRG